MELLKAKTQFYLIILSLIFTVLGMGIMKFSHGSAPAAASRATTTVQKLDALDKALPHSSDMSKFLQREKTAEQANQDGAEALK